MNRLEFLTRIEDSLRVALHILDDNLEKVIELGIPPQDSEEFLELLRKRKVLADSLEEMYQTDEGAV